MSLSNENASSLYNLINDVEEEVDIEFGENLWNYSPLTLKERVQSSVARDDVRKRFDSLKEIHQQTGSNSKISSTISRSAIVSYDSENDDIPQEILKYIEEKAFAVAKGLQSSVSFSERRLSQSLDSPTRYDTISSDGTNYLSTDHSSLDNIFQQNEAPSSLGDVSNDLNKSKESCVSECCLNEPDQELTGSEICVETIGKSRMGEIFDDKFLDYFRLISQKLDQFNELTVQTDLYEKEESAIVSSTVQLHKKAIDLCNAIHKIEFETMKIKYEVSGVLPGGPKEKSSCGNFYYKDEVEKIIELQQQLEDVRKMAKLKGCYLAMCEATKSRISIENDDLKEDIRKAKAIVKGYEKEFNTIKRAVCLVKKQNNTSSQSINPASFSADRESDGEKVHTLGSRLAMLGLTDPLLTEQIGATSSKNDGFERLPSKDKKTTELIRENPNYYQQQTQQYQTKEDKNLIIARTPNTNLQDVEETAAVENEQVVSFTITTGYSHRSNKNTQSSKGSTSDKAIHFQASDHDTNRNNEAINVTPTSSQKAKTKREKGKKSAENGSQRSGKQQLYETEDACQPNEATAVSEAESAHGSLTLPSRDNEVRQEKQYPTHLPLKPNKNRGYVVKPISPSRPKSPEYQQKSQNSQNATSYKSNQQRTSRTDLPPGRRQNFKENTDDRKEKNRKRDAKEKLKTPAICMCPGSSKGKRCPCPDCTCEKPTQQSSTYSKNSSPSTREHSCTCDPSIQNFLDEVSSDSSGQGRTESAKNSSSWCHCQSEEKQNSGTGSSVCSECFCVIGEDEKPDDRPEIPKGCESYSSFCACDLNEGEMEKITEDSKINADRCCCNGKRNEKDAEDSEIGIVSSVNEAETEILEEDSKISSDECCCIEEQNEMVSEDAKSCTDICCCSKEDIGKVTEDSIAGTECYCEKEEQETLTVDKINTNSPSVQQSDWEKCTCQSHFCVCCQCKEVSQQPPNTEGITIITSQESEDTYSSEDSNTSSGVVNEVPSDIPHREIGDLEQHQIPKEVVDQIKGPTENPGITSGKVPDSDKKLNKLPTNMGVNKEPNETPIEKPIVPETEQAEKPRDPFIQVPATVPGETIIEVPSRTSKASTGKMPNKKPSKPLNGTSTPNVNIEKEPNKKPGNPPIKVPPVTSSSIKVPSRGSKASVSKVPGSKPSNTAQINSPPIQSEIIINHPTGVSDKNIAKEPATKPSEISKETPGKDLTKLPAIEIEKHPPISIPNDRTPTQNAETDPRQPTKPPNMDSTPGQLIERPIQAITNTNPKDKQTHQRPTQNSKEDLLTPWPNQPSASEILKTCQEKLRDCQTENEHLQIEKHTINAENQRLQDEISRCLKNYNSCLAEKKDNAAIREQISNLLKENASLQKQFEETENRINKIEVEKEMLNEINTKLKDDLQVVRAQIVASTVDCQEYVNKIKQLESQVQTLTHQNEETLKENGNCKIKLDKCQEDLAQCYKELTKPTNDTKEEMVRPVESADCKEWIDLAAKYEDRIKHHRLQVVKRTFLLLIAEKERNDLRAERLELKTALQTCKEDLKKSLSKNKGSALESQINSPMSEIERHRALTEKLQSTNDALTKEKDNALNQVQKIQNRLIECEEENHLLRTGDESKIAEQFRKLLKENTELEGKAAKLIADLTLCNTRYSECRAKLGACEMKLRKSSTGGQLTHDISSTGHINLEDQVKKVKRLQKLYMILQTEFQKIICTLNCKPCCENIQDELMKMYHAIDWVKKRIFCCSCRKAADQDFAPECLSGEDQILHSICLKIVVGGTRSLNFNQLIYLHCAIYRVAANFGRNNCSRFPCEEIPKSKICSPRCDDKDQQEKRKKKKGKSFDKVRILERELNIMKKLLRNFKKCCKPSPNLKNVP